MKRYLLSAIVILGLLLAIAASGCMSIPGPGDPTPRATTPLVKDTVTKARVTTSEAALATTPATAAATRVPTATPSVPATPAAVKKGDAAASCQAQGGYIVQAGQVCSGTWMDASDTFSCCASKPVSGSSRNVTIAAEPFDLAVQFNDDLGSITP